MIRPSDSRPSSPHGLPHQPRGASPIVTARLANGLTVAVERIDGVASAAVQWLLPAGGAHDADGRRGVAAMLEELLLRGAGELSSRDQADAFDVLGVNRGTELGLRTLSVSATMLGSSLPAAMPLLADMVLRPHLAEDSIEPVRDLCLQGIASLADEPRDRASYAARARHFAQPFDRCELGVPEQLEAITRDDVARAWRRGGVPGGSILAVTGRVDPDSVIRQAEQLLGAWSGPAPMLNAGTLAPRGYGHEPESSAQVQIILLHDAPPAGHPDRVLETVATAVLSGGMSGRLFSEVREKRGLCYAVAASYRAHAEFGTLTAYVGTSPDRAQQSLDVLVQELNRLADGVEADEFDRAMTGLRSRWVFSGESTAARASTIANDILQLGRPLTLDEQLEELRGVTLDRLNRYLAGRAMGRVTIQTLGAQALTPPAGTT